MRGAETASSVEVPEQVDLETSSLQPGQRRTGVGKKLRRFGDNLQTWDSYRRSEPHHAHQGSKSCLETHLGVGQALPFSVDVQNLPQVDVSVEGTNQRHQSRQGHNNSQKSGKSTRTNERTEQRWPHRQSLEFGEWDERETRILPELARENFESQAITRKAVMADVPGVPGAFRARTCSREGQEQISCTGQGERGKPPNKERALRALGRVQPEPSTQARTPLSFQVAQCCFSIKATQKTQCSSQVQRQSNISQIQAGWLVLGPLVECRWHLACCPQPSCGSSFFP